MPWPCFLPWFASFFALPFTFPPILPWTFILPWITTVRVIPFPCFVTLLLSSHAFFLCLLLHVLFVLSFVFSSTWPWPRYLFTLLFISFSYCFVFYLSSFFMSLSRFLLICLLPRCHALCLTCSRLLGPVSCLPSHCLVCVVLFAVPIPLSFTSPWLLPLEN